jgi:hypothetical protein
MHVPSTTVLTFSRHDYDDGLLAKSDEIQGSQQDCECKESSAIVMKVASNPFHVEFVLVTIDSLCVHVEACTKSTRKIAPSKTMGVD